MWKLAHLQAAAMEAHGIMVIITRFRKEKNMNVVERGKMADGADIFESLHSNAWNTERVDRPDGIWLYEDECVAIDVQSKEFAALMGQTVRDCKATEPAYRKDEALKGKYKVAA